MNKLRGSITVQMLLVLGINYFRSKEICTYTQDSPNKDCFFECKYIERCSKHVFKRRELHPISLQ